MKAQLRLDGQTAIVTGGGTGLGQAMALALAEAGAAVVLAARRREPLEETARQIRERSREALVVPTDITDPAQVDHLVATALERLGAVDILVNNAALVGSRSVPIWEVTDEEWEAAVRTNLTGAFYCSRAVARHMVERARGRIINVASGFGLRGGRDNYAYTATKGGVIQLTRTLAVSLGQYGVTCNCIVPGFFLTSATRQDEERLRARAEFIPVGRIGDPQELGPLVVYLASGASAYVNGALFIADGGGLAGGYAPTGFAPFLPLEG